MVQVGRGRQHAVLVVAEAGQGGLHEARQAGQGLLPGDGEPEVIKAAETVRKALRDQVQHLPGHGIEVMPKGLRQEEVASRRGPVLGVEVPAPAGGRLALHEEAGTPAHLAVEEFHAQGLAALRPGLEVRVGGQEPPVFQQGHRDPQGGGPAVGLQFQAPFPRLCEVDRRGAMAAHGPLQLAAQGSGIVPVVQPDEIDPPAGGRQSRGEVAHGRQDQDDLLPVVPDIGRLAHDLRHQHHGARRIASPQGGQGVAQLVSEDQDEIGHGAIMPRSAGAPYQGTVRPSASKKPPEAEAGKASMTARSLPAAVAGLWAFSSSPTKGAESGVATVPG